MRGEGLGASVDRVNSSGSKRQGGGPGAFSDKACLEKRNRRRAPVRSVLDRMDDLGGVGFDCSCCCDPDALVVSSGINSSSTIFRNFIGRA